ncbi:MAG: YgaP family membrane protein [Aggregatilineaceae bacterium]
MDSLFSFVASQTGRIVRGIVGIALIVIGLLLVNGDASWGWILVIVGLVPLAAGVFDFCLFAPLFGKPFKGANLRAALSRKKE